MQSKLDALAPPDAPAHVGVQVRNRLWIQDAHKVGVQNTGERIVRCMGAWVRTVDPTSSGHYVPRLVRGTYERVPRSWFSGHAACKPHTWDMLNNNSKRSQN